jgi:hypothetical protein
VQGDVSFSVPEQLHIQSLGDGPGGITIHAAPKDPGARCPECGGRSGRVHSRYNRTLARSAVGRGSGAPPGARA